MEIIVGFEDFKECVEDMVKKGKWGAWCDYFKGYRNVFEPMLKYLYMMNLNEMKPLVEKFDFEKALCNAGKFLREDGIKNVKSLFLRSEKTCKVEEDYTVYLLIGLGNVDGTALPADKLFIYFGLELYRSPQQLTYLVPHKYNHLVRISTLKYGLKDFKNVTVKDLTILEGLGTLFPLILSRKDINQLSIVDAGMMPNDVAKYCYKHEKEIKNEIFSVWDRNFSKEIMTKYFQGTSDGWMNDKPAKMGYYVGSRIIGDLLKKGHDICELTKTSSDEIFTMWRTTI